MDYLELGHRLAANSSLTVKEAITELRTVRSKTGISDEIEQYNYLKNKYPPK